MKRSVRALVTVGACVLLAASCSSNGLSSRAATTRTATPLSESRGATGSLGTVTGRVFGFGGPSPGRQIAVANAGVVTLTSEDHSYAAPYDADGRFKIALPPGTYRMKAPAFNGGVCTGKVRVVVAQVARASAVCPIP